MEAEQQISKIIDEAEIVDITDDGAAAPGAAKSKTTQVDQLLELANGATLFHTPDGQGFADINVKGHRETWPLDSKDFGNWLRHRYFNATGRAPAQNAMVEACRTLEAKAQFESPKIPVHLRVCDLDGRLYLDLADEEWRVVEADVRGWRVVDDPPVRFRRVRGMRPLPLPQKGGSIDDLRPCINVQHDSAFVLAVSWVLACLRGRGPYPLLVVTGEQGSAKSTFSGILRDLVDPNEVALRALPRSEHDLYIAANNGHVLAFDNVSHLSGHFSDTFCRLATGGGYATRALYTNDDEKLFNVCRPILLNGIVDIVGRPDLADRAVFLTLKPITDAYRRTKEELDAAFSHARPRILGALLDAVVVGLRKLPEVRMEFPRMADFARWVTACETAFWPPGTFVAALEQNRKGAVEEISALDPVIEALRTLIGEAREWRGTATQLLEILSDIAGQRTARSRSWPTTAQVLSSYLKRVAPVLRSTGISVEQAREGKGRSRMIRISLVAAGPALRMYQGRSADAEAARPQDAPELPRSQPANDEGRGADEPEAIVRPVHTEPFELKRRS